MDKIELLKKLKKLSTDNRGNINERLSAEKLLNELILKYNINPNDINTDKLIRRDFYFKEEWEIKLLGQTLYMLFPEKDMYRYHNKRNWVWVDMTDAEYLEFETHYCAYKASYQHEQALFFTAFISKNRIFPNEDNLPEDRKAKSKDMNKADRIRTAMMMEGIESTNVRRLLNE